LEENAENPGLRQQNALKNELFHINEHDMRERKHTSSIESESCGAAERGRKHRRPREERQKR
jgi:hypothetical protein